MSALDQSGFYDFLETANAALHGVIPKDGLLTLPSGAIVHLNLLANNEIDGKDTLAVYLGPVAWGPCCTHLFLCKSGITDSDHFQAFDEDYGLYWNLNWV